MIDAQIKVTRLSTKISGFSLAVCCISDSRHQVPGPDHVESAGQARDDIAQHARSTAAPY